MTEDFRDVRFRNRELAMLVAANYLSKQTEFAGELNAFSRCKHSREGREAWGWFSFAALANFARFG